MFIFLIAHFNSEAEATKISNQYLNNNEEILLCGTTNYVFDKKKNIPYHPLFYINDNATIAQQQHYIDTMCRAIQIEVPIKLIFHSSSKLDNNNLVQKIKQHAKIVGVNILEMTNN